MRQKPRLTLALLALGALGWTQAALADPTTDELQSSYSYVRTVDGRATLTSAGNGPGDDVDLQQPLMRGDQLRVDRGARIEVALADRNLLRVDGGSVVRLTRVAFSADGNDRATRLDLDGGEILLVVTEQALGDELPEIRVADASVFVHEPGTYRIRVDASGALELTVRSGFAEVLTERGSTIVRAGEQAWTTGGRWGAVEVGGAGTFDALERWSDQLERRATVARQRTLHVEPYLSYQAATLDGYGDWVSIDSSWYWRPRVASDWRPYWQGRWAWTPSGMTWVSSEPWGWVPYHYGTWVRVAGYGWVWQPGRVYSPAWVYWYWGPSWTGWVPTGYYTHYYRPYWQTGFRFGIYGWTGGSWGLYADWSFCPTIEIGLRGHHGRYRGGNDLARTGHLPPPHGILTTDTRPIPRRGWERPDDLMRRLSGRNDGRDHDLPVVTEFVERRRELSPNVRRAIEREPGPLSHPRLATPLDPGAPRQTAADHRKGTDGLPGWRGARDASRDDSSRRGGFERGNPAPTGPADAGARPNAWGTRVGSGGSGAGVSRFERTPPVRSAPTDKGRSPQPSERNRGEVTLTHPTSAPTIDRSDRQGWRLRGGFGEPADPGRATGSTSGGNARGYSAPVDRGDRWQSPSAVDRVITGVRRNQAPTSDPAAGDQGWRRFSTPPSGENGNRPSWTPPSRESAPRFTPGWGSPAEPRAIGSPSAGSRFSQPPATGSGGSRFSGPQGRSSGTVRSTPSPRSQPSSQGQGRSSASSSGGNRSQASNRQSGNSDNRSSSPPPRHQQRRDPPR